MPNKQSAKDWLTQAFHDLNGAIILFEAKHYTDTIGYILQQSLEKILKSILAYDNQKIKKSHNLVELNEIINNRLNLTENDIRLLAIATTYGTKLRYPTPHKKSPQEDEIKEVLDFAKKLFEKVCQILRYRSTRDTKLKNMVIFKIIKLSIKLLVKRKKINGHLYTRFWKPRIWF